MFGYREPEDPSSQLVSLNLNASDEELAEKAAKERRWHERVRQGSLVTLMITVPLLLLVGVGYFKTAREVADLVEIGRRARAIRIGEPLRVHPRRGSSYWRVDYAFAAGNRTYAGRVGLYRVPASLVVVFDPRDPARHRIVGSINPLTRIVYGLLSAVIGTAVALVGFLKSRRWLAANAEGDGSGTITRQRTSPRR
jgi:hypothetical protein